MLNANDHMDELMRRAAEAYPLKTSGQDFEKVLQGLQVEKGQTNNRNKKTRFLWLLLLLPLSFLCNRYLYPGVADNAKNNSVTVTSGSTITNERPSNQGIINDKEKFQKTNTTADNKIAKVDKPLQNNINTATTIVDDLDLKQLPGKANIAAIAKDSNTTVIRNSTPGKQTPKLVNNSDMPTEAEEGTNRQLLIAGKKQTKEITENVQAKSSLNEGKISEALESDDPTERMVYQDELKHLELSREANNNSKPAALSEPKRISTADTSQRKSNNNKTKYFYAGIVAGPDVSAVKSTSISKMGITAGVLVGYKLSKSVNLETGFYYNKKFYKSDGKYFDAKNLTIPSYVKIIDLEGYCNMYELPLNLKVELVNKKQHQWYGLIGSSTYIMKKEEYHYEYMNYGIPVYRTAAYDNSGTNWFSIINLGVGYSQQLGKSGLFRLEPNFKIPVNGVGAGNLPLSSFGIMAGYQYDIF